MSEYPNPIINEKHITLNGHTYFNTGEIVYKKRSYDTYKSFYSDRKNSEEGTWRLENDINFSLIKDIK